MVSGAIARSLSLSTTPLQACDAFFLVDFEPINLPADVDANQMFRLFFVVVRLFCIFYFFIWFVRFR